MPKLIPITKNELPSLLPKRAEDAHKYAGGKSLIIAGSQGLWGAAYLSAKACYRVGAGFVYLSDKTPELTLHPHFLSLPISEDMPLDTFAAIAMGPGLTLTQEIRKTFSHIQRHFSKPVVIDAAALPLVTELSKDWIITPHEGELAKLINITADEIRADRYKAVRLAQDSFGGIVVLKGHRTLVANDHNTFEIQTGNRALAKAGTGDVLTGMITGFLSQGLKPINATVLACGLHGYLADRWVETKDHLSLIASDLIDLLPEAIFTLREEK